MKHKKNPYNVTKSNENKQLNVFSLLFILRWRKILFMAFFLSENFHQISILSFQDVTQCFPLEFPTSFKSAFISTLVLTNLSISTITIARHVTERTSWKNNLRKAVYAIS